MKQPKSESWGNARSDGPSVQDILRKDKRPAPALWLTETNTYLGSSDLDKERYISRDFHEREKARLWPRVWQIACHTQQIPNVGDYYVYENVGHSVIVVRVAPDSIRAYHNACLHRGTTLCEGTGNVRGFRCPFHGWTWDLEGVLRKVTTAWDFPHVDKECFALPQARVSTWGGFVFVNFDPGAPALLDYMENLPTDFAPWPLEKRYLVAHVEKQIRCNWKIALEAFSETYHINPTHPELADTGAYAETQYDVSREHRHTNRMIMTSAVPGTPSARTWSEEELIKAHVMGMGIKLRSTEDEAPFTLPSGMSARAYAGELLRSAMSRDSGVDLSGVSDSEVVDGVQYLLFPNFLLWAGYSFPIMYRYRPLNDDHETCIMDLYILSPWPDGKPMLPAGPTIRLGLDQPMADAAPLGLAAAGFEQDMRNLPRIQRGLHNLKKGVTLANYQESRIRHFNQTVDWYLAR